MFVLFKNPKKRLLRKQVLWTGFVLRKGRYLSFILFRKVDKKWLAISSHSVGLIGTLLCIIQVYCNYKVCVKRVLSRDLFSSGFIFILLGNSRLVLLLDFKEYQTAGFDAFRVSQVSHITMLIWKVN